MLLAICIAFPLLLFAVPGVTVYDGSRLFLVVFPLWAMLIGRGGMLVVDRLRKRFSAKNCFSICAIAVAIQTATIVTVRPCYLSYYNGFVGGLWGAEKIGLETTYWGDSVSRGFLQEVSEQVPANTTIDVSPVLHELQLPGLIENSPILRNHGIRLRGYDEDRNKPAKYLIVFRRRADLAKNLDPPENATLLAEVRRQGVLLAALYRFDHQQQRKLE